MIPVSQPRRAGRRMERKTASDGAVHMEVRPCGWQEGTCERCWAGLSWEAALGRRPAALLGFLGFHSSVILIFSPLKSVSH